jgi:hypothetical protein
MASGSKKKDKKKSKVKVKAKAKKPTRGAKPAGKTKKPAKAKAAKPAPKTAAKAPAKGGAAAAKGAAPAPHAPAEAAKVPGRPSGKAPKRGRGSRLALRRGPDGQPLQPGEILVPGGIQNPDEIQYLLRGCVAAEHPDATIGVEEILSKKGGEGQDRGGLMAYAQGMAKRFDGGSIESLLPVRPAARRNFQGVVERAKHRRREIGAFLRGLDLGRTETSHMDSHGEASLQSLMEWAARLENLAEADEPDQADYAQFHRGLDQLENTTEALILDVEQTLRRLRDRLKAQ